MFLAESKFNFAGKTALVRIDTDVDLRLSSGRLTVDEDFRLRSSLPTIDFLKKRKIGRIILLGHIGRPGGRPNPRLSLRPVADWFTENVAVCRLEALDIAKNQLAGNFIILENLRFDPGEKANRSSFAGGLSSLADVYINDAFAVSHRRHASIVGLPDHLPAFLGFRFQEEIKTLSWLRKSVFRPLVFVFGGSKPGKLDYLDFLSGWADELLVGGKLPSLIKNAKLKIKSCGGKLILGKLRESGKDIDKETIKEFEKLIGGAKTVIWAGPMGVYEEKEFCQGSWRVAAAVADSGGFKVAGGGDTHRILTKLSLWQKMDYVSVGGGSMLEFLQKGDLPGIKAIKVLKK